MHTFHQGLSAAGSRTRLILMALAVAAFATFALAAGGASTASAAGPNQLPPEGSVIYPTWFWGATELCATNNTGSPAMVRVRATVNIDNQVEDMYVPGFQKVCIRRWWWANPIQVTNISGSALGTGAVVTTRST